MEYFIFAGVCFFLICINIKDLRKVFRQEFSIRKLLATMILGVSSLFLIGGFILSSLLGIWEILPKQPVRTGVPITTTND